jgi:hypothetical protein
MIRHPAVVSVMALLLAAGVAVAEPVAYPANGQSFDQQNQDETECHEWAQKDTGVDPVAVAEQATGSSQPNSESKSGLGSGLRGAGVGAMRGAAGGDAGAGALRGVGIGRLVAVVRARRQMEKRSEGAGATNSELRAELEKYDRAYAGCLTERGYTVK